MLIPFLTTVIVTALHAATGIVSSRSVTVQLAVILIVLAQRYGHPAFAWRVAVLTGLGFDLLAGTPFGLFTLLFFLTAWAAEMGMERAERLGLALTTAGLTAGATIVVGAVSGWLAGQPTGTVAVSALLSALLTVVVAQAAATYLDRRLARLLPSR